jgi:hypothetical protein
MSPVTTSAINAVEDSEIAYCKFITPNDAGTTGAHQSGYHIHKDSYQIAFSEPGERGSNIDRTVIIKWQDDFQTESRFIYYGTGSRNEYRLTRFGRDFPFHDEDDIGNLLIICKMSDDGFYKAYVLDTEESIEDFLGTFNLSPMDANGIIEKSSTASGLIDTDLTTMYARYISGLAGRDFPPTVQLAAAARQFADEFYRRNAEAAVNDPDDTLSSWIETEYSLFKALENDRYKEALASPSQSVEELVALSNTILNRRKSRAGKSLEHHLAAIFDDNRLPYTAQGSTEGDRKPDFLFPGTSQYRDMTYSSSGLVFLGAKTTCKDRWRQVLNEAARIPDKHLFTLQQGISSNQLREMAEERLTLVIPAQNMGLFPAEHRENILDLKTFIKYTREKVT